MQLVNVLIRFLIGRCKEHQGHWFKGEVRKSSVAKHMIQEFHGFGLSNLKLLKSVPRNSYLDAFESLYIQRNQKTMNSDEGPIISPLFKLTADKDRKRQPKIPQANVLTAY
ncbi:hypothetical protein ACFFRR_001332 [Megaselia abdita]